MIMVTHLARCGALKYCVSRQKYAGFVRYEVFMAVTAEYCPLEYGTL